MTIERVIVITAPLTVGGGVGFSSDGGVAPVTALTSARLTTVKVRPAGDYRDPGPYKNPPGTVAYEWTGAAPTPAKAEPAAQKASFDIVDPRRHGGMH